MGYRDNRVIRQSKELDTMGVLRFTKCNKMFIEAHLIVSGINTKIFLYYMVF